MCAFDVSCSSSSVLSRCRTASPAIIFQVSQPFFFPKSVLYCPLSSLLSSNLSTLTLDCLVRIMSATPSCSLNKALSNNWPKEPNYSVSTFQIQTTVQIMMLLYDVLIHPPLIYFWLNFFWFIHMKGKAILVTSREGPQGCETSRLPHFLDNRLIDGGEVVSPTRRPALHPPGRFLVLISVRGWVDPRAIVRLEGLRQLKNPMTPPGIEPATFRLVA
jgi:hypothetical protein